MSKKLYVWVGLIPIGLSLIMAVIILTAFKALPPKLPLFYSLPWGNGQLATQQQFLIIPANIIFITFLNMVIFWQLHPSQLFLKRVLLISSIAVSLILVITFIKIILLFA